MKKENGVDTFSPPSLALLVPPIPPNAVRVAVGVDEPGLARSNLLRPSLILIQKLTLSRQVQFGIPPKVYRIG